MSSRFSRFVAELKRRRIHRVATVYVTVGAGTIGVIAEAVPAWEQVRTPVVLLIIAGLPIALVLTWAYRIRPDEPKAGGHVAGSPPASVVEAEKRRSIVVLPFDNMSPDPGDAYFSDGLTEEIITTLSNLRSLRVISRSSAMVFKGTQKDVRTIGKELDVQYVLEGSVRKAGNDLRITAQLIDAISDEHLWAERYDGVLDDVFGMQEDVSRSIVEALKLSLGPEEHRRLAQRPMEDARALDCYLKARSEMMEGGAENLRRAMHNLKMGVKILGGNDVLYQGMAEVHLMSYEYGVTQNEETLQKAEEYTNRMDSLRSDSAHSHYLRGRIERFRGSSTGAAVHWERALVIDPNHLNSLLWLVGAYSIQAGRPTLARSLVQRLSEIDPLTPLTVFVIGMYHWMAGRLAQAASAFSKAAALDTSGFFLHPHAAYVLVWQGRSESALALLDRIIERNRAAVLTEWAHFLKHALRGEKKESLAALSQDVKKYLWSDPEAQWLAASTYALLGEDEETRKWLQHCIDRGWINYPIWSHGDPLLQNVRDEKWFKEMMHRVRRDWEAFGAD